MGKNYTVVAGDSLSKIAKREYGDANAWKRIYEANRDIIKDPDLIYPGQTLKIPAKAQRRKETKDDEEHEESDADSAGPRVRGGDDGGLQEGGEPARRPRRASCA